MLRKQAINLLNRRGIPVENGSIALAARYIRANQRRNQITDATPRIMVNVIEANCSSLARKLGDYKPELQEAA